MKLSSAAGIAANTKLLKPHRIAPLKHLGVGDARVANVGVHAAFTVAIRRRARAARNGFIKAKPRVAKQKIVDGALTARTKIEGAPQQIHKPLAGFSLSNRTRGTLVGRA